MLISYEMLYPKVHKKGKQELQQLLDMYLLWVYYLSAELDFWKVKELTAEIIQATIFSLLLEREWRTGSKSVLPPLSLGSYERANQKVHQEKVPQAIALSLVQLLTPPTIIKSHARSWRLSQEEKYANDSVIPTAVT